MMRLSVLFPILLTALALTGCGDKDADPSAYNGPVYPPTDQVQYIFQASQAPPECKVFAELLVTMPAGVHGDVIRKEFEAEAESRGADMVLLGQSRRMEDDEGLNFLYYIPEREYVCSEKWCGWKYGFEVWEEQGEFVTIGYREWGSKAVQFEFPVMTQAAFLHCGEKR